MQGHHDKVNWQYFISRCRYVWVDLQPVLGPLIYRFQDQTSELQRQSQGSGKVGGTCI